MNKKNINNNVILMIKLLFFLIISTFLINRFGYNSIIPLAILVSSYFAIIHHKKIIHFLINFVPMRFRVILPSHFALRTSHSDCSRNHNNVILMIKLLFFLIISIFLINKFGYNSIIPLAILVFSYFAIIHHKKIIHPFVNFVSLCLCGIFSAECRVQSAEKRIKSVNSSIRQFANSLIHPLWFRFKGIFQSFNLSIFQSYSKREMGRPSPFVLVLVVMILLLSTNYLFADFDVRNHGGGDPDTPGVTIYLGDNALTFGCDAWATWGGQWGGSRVYIHTSADINNGTPGGDWSYNDKDHKTNTSAQFTDTGTWYWGMLIRYNFDGDQYGWYCQDDSDWHRHWGDPTSNLTVTVHDLPTPKSVFAIAESDTIIYLQWEQDDTYDEVMVVARANADLSADPTQGTGYSVTDSLGNGTVIYKGNAESFFTHENLTPGDSYYYRFYTVNNDYYSPTTSQTKRNIHTTLPNLLKESDVDWNFEDDDGSWDYTTTDDEYPYSSDKLYGSNGFSWSSNTQTNSGREATTTDFFPVDPDGTYTLGIYAYNSTVNWEGVRWRIGVAWFDEDDEQIGNFSYSSDFSFENRSSWELGEWTGIEPPADAVSAKFRFQNWRADGNSGRTTFDVAYFIGPPAPPSLDVSPDEVYQDSTLDQIFTLTLERDEFAAGLASGHISLDDDFDGLNIVNVTRNNATEATVRLTGDLEYDDGQGVITVSASGLEGDESVSAIVSVIPRIQSFPHNEDFSHDGAIPAGWNLTGFNISATGTHRRVGTHAISLSAGDDGEVESITFDYTDLIASDLSFWYRATSASNNSTIEVLASIDGGNNYNIPVVSEFIINWVNDNHHELTADQDISSLDGESEVRFKWIVSREGGIISLDDITFTATSDVTSATLDPTTANYDLDAPANVSTEITWNDASSVNEVLDDGTPLTVNTDYEISGNNLIINSSYLASEIPQAGNAVVLTVDFDEGSNATFTVTAIASSPAFSSAETNEEGSVITVTFDKDMADPSAKHGQFSFKIDGGSRSFSAASLDADVTKINLTVDGAAIEPGDDVTLSYTPGDVKCSKGGSLDAFTDNAVTNNSIRPSIGITKPITSADAYHDTSIKTITISGTVENIEAGDTIEIFTNSTSNQVITLVADSVSWIGSAELTGLEDDVWVKLTSHGGDFVKYDTITVNYYHISWANLQWPASGNIRVGDEFNVYARFIIDGKTDEEAVAIPGVSAWIGYNADNTNPSGWANWVPMSFKEQIGNNHEYELNLGAEIPTHGTYYYASRFKYDEGDYVYGGFQGGFWDGSDNVSGVLTVEHAVYGLASKSEGDTFYVGSSGNANDDTLTLAVNINRAFNDNDVFIFYIKTTGNDTSVGRDWNGTHNLPGDYNYSVIIRPNGSLNEVWNVDGDGNWVWIDPQPNRLYSQDWDNGEFQFDIKLEHLGHDNSLNIDIIAYQFNQANNHEIIGITPDKNDMGVSSVDLLYYWTYVLGTDEFIENIAGQAPTNQPTDFIASASSDTVIRLNWSDAVGGTLPDSYLIKWSDDGFGDIGSPVDGTPEADAADVKNISYGLEEILIKGLSTGTRYYFKIFPYAGIGENIMFKTDDAPQSSAVPRFAPEIAITKPAESESSYDTSVQIINVSGTLNNALSGDTVEIWTTSATSGTNLNTTVVLVGSHPETWSGTAQLTGVGDSISVKVISFDNEFNNFDTITVNYHYISYANIKSPDSVTIRIGDDFIVTGELFIDGKTNVLATEIPNLSVDIGYNSENTNPSGWTNWVSANFDSQEGNNHEYSANIGSEFSAIGTYYYAIRYKFDEGDTLYSGTDGFWTEASHSGILNVKHIIYEVESSLEGETFYVGSSGNTGSDTITLIGNFGQSFRNTAEIKDGYVFYIKSSGTYYSNKPEGWSNTHTLPGNFHYAIFMMPHLGPLFEVKEVNASREWVNVDPQPDFFIIYDASGEIGIELLLNDLGHTAGDSIGIFAFHINAENGEILGITPKDNPIGLTNAELSFDTYWEYRLGTDVFNEKFVGLPPQNHVSDFSATTQSDTVIELTWTDAVGDVLPDSYLIKWSTVSYEDIDTPVTGIIESDNTGRKNVSYASEQILITNLTPWTKYYFKIFPYKLNDDYIMFKLDGVVPSDSDTTLKGNLLSLNEIDWAFDLTYPSATWDISDAMDYPTTTGPSPKFGTHFARWEGFIGSRYFQSADSFPVDADKVHNASIWLASSSTSGNHARARTNIEIIWYDANGSIIRSDKSDTFSLSAINTWELKEFHNLIPPIKAVTARYRINAFPTENVIQAYDGAFIVETIDAVRSPGFEISASTTEPDQNVSFNIFISEAVNDSNEILDGSFNITVTSDSTDEGTNGEVYSAARTFTQGSAWFSITLTQYGEQELSIQIASITEPETIVVDVQPYIPPENMLANWDFESWSGTASNANDLDNWDYSSTANHITRSEDGLVGNYSARFTPIVTAANLDCTPLINIESSGTLYSEVWVKALNSDADNYIRMSLLISNPTNGNFPNASGDWALVDYTEEDGWVKLSRTREVDAGASGGVRIRAQRNGSEGPSLLIGAVWLSDGPPPPGWPYPDPIIEIKQPVTSGESHDTVFQIIDVSGQVQFMEDNYTIEIWTTPAVGESYLNRTISVANGASTWNGTAALSGIGDSVWVKLTSGDSVVYDTITVNYTRHYLDFYFKSPDWLTGQPEVWGPFMSSWAGESMTLDGRWWHAQVDVIDSNVSLTYQIRLYDDDDLKFQKATGNLDANPTIETSTGEVWIDGSLNADYTWCDDDIDFYLPDTCITINMPMPTVEITTPVSSDDIYDTSAITISISGSVSNVEAADTIEIWTISESRGSFLNNTISLTKRASEWSGTARLTGLYDSIVVKLTSYDIISYDTVTVHYCYVFESFEDAFTHETTDYNGWKFNSIDQSDDQKRTGDYSALIDLGTDSMITPLLIFPDTLTFYLFASEGVSSFLIEKSHSTDGPWEQIVDITDNLNGTWNLQTINLSGYSNIYLRFRRNHNRNYYIDDVVITISDRSSTFNLASSTLTPTSGKSFDIFISDAFSDNNDILEGNFNVKISSDNTSEGINGLIHNEAVNFIDGGCTINITLYEDGEQELEFEIASISTKDTLALVVQPEPENYIPNWSFEEGDGTNADSWPSVSSTGVTRNSEKSLSGSWSVKQSNITASLARNIKSDTFDITGGDSYHLAGHYYITNPGSGDTVNYELFFRVQYDGIEDGQTPDVVFNPVQFDTWVRVDFPVTAPADKSYANVLITARRTSTGHPTTDVFWDALWFSDAPPVDEWPPLPVLEPEIYITSPVSSNQTHDTIIQLIDVRGIVANARAGDQVEIWTKCSVSDTLNTTVVLTGTPPTEWSGTALLTGMGDSVWVKLISGDSVAYDTITVNFLGDQIRFFFKAPQWMTNTPAVWRFAEGEWSGETMTLVGDWWWADVNVDDANAEVTYQMRFTDAYDVMKYQKTSDDLDPTITTTTSEVWIDASNDRHYTWAGNDFYLSDDRITTFEPEHVFFYFLAPAWMTGAPEIWGQFRSGTLTGNAMFLNTDNNWWEYDVVVPDSTAELTYQLRFRNEDGVMKYQKATGNMGNDAKITTTTSEVWIVGSNNVDYTWEEEHGNEFYLGELADTMVKIVTEQPSIINLYFYLPSWANDATPLISYNVPSEGFFAYDLGFTKTDEATAWNDQWLSHTFVPPDDTEPIRFYFRFWEGDDENQIYMDAGGENWFVETTTTGEIWVDASIGLIWIQDGPPKRFWLDGSYVTDNVSHITYNWHFDDWTSGISDTPPDNWAWSGAPANVNRSTDAFIGHYSTKLTLTTTSQRRFLTQYGKTMSEHRNYYVTVFAKGQGVMTIGYKNPQTQTYRESAEIVVDTTVWTKYTYMASPTGSDSDGGIRIGVKYNNDSGIPLNSEILIGAAWLSDIATTEDWPEIISPTIHATNFDTSMLYSNKVKLSWTDAQRFENLPYGYLIKWSDVGFADISNPVNGVLPVDGENQKRVYPGVEEAVITGLSPETKYYFRIFPYSIKHDDARYLTVNAPTLEVTTRESNLLPNWHFEEWTGLATSADDLVDWKFFGTASNVTQTEDALYERYAAQVMLTTTERDLMPLSDIPVLGADTYYAEIWIKPIAVNENDYARIDLRIANPEDGTYESTSYSDYKVAGEWIQIRTERYIEPGDSGGIRIRSLRVGDAGPGFIIGAAWFGDTLPPTEWPPTNIITFMPRQVNENDEFAAIFSLNLFDVDFVDPVLVEHFSLGDDFEGFDIDFINRVSSSRVNFQISGELKAVAGRGRITILPDGTTGSEPITAVILVSKMNYLDNWHFDEGWQGGTTQHDPGNPVSWVWGNRGELSDTALVGNKSFLHEPYDGVYRYLYQYGHNLINREYHLVIYAKGTGMVRPGFKHSDTIVQRGTGITLDNDGWTRIEYSNTSPGDTDDGGPYIGLSRKSATGEALYLGAVWFGDRLPPDGWPFRVVANNAFAIVDDDTSAADERADTVAVLNVSVMAASNFVPVPNFEITLDLLEGNADSLTVRNENGDILDFPCTSLTNNNGTANFYLTSTVSGTFVFKATGLSEDFVDTAIVRFDDWLDIEEGWDTIGTIIDGVTISQDTFILEPIWSPDGKYISYLGRYDSNRWDLYKINTETFQETKLGNGQLLKINNMSRISWNYNINGDTNYVVVTGWKLNPATNNYVSTVFALKTDGSDSNRTISELPAAQQILSGVTGNIHSADIIRNSDTMVLDAGYINLTVYSKSSDTRIPLLYYLNNRFNNGDTHPNYAIGQARWCPNGKHIAFVRIKGEFGKWVNMKRSDIFVLFDVHKIISGESEPIYPPNPPVTSSGPACPVGLGWDDPRLLKLTNNNDNFNWNPNWNKSGDIVNWSSDENQHFNLLNYLTTSFQADATYDEFSNAQFNIYMRKIDDLSKRNVSDVIKVSQGEGNHFSMNYNFDGPAKTTNINISDNKIFLKILEMSNKADITQNGGILFDNGKTTIVVPPDVTLSQGTQISIDVPTHTPTPGSHDRVKIVEDGVAREFFPHGATFSEPVELILYYTEEQLLEYGIINNSPQEQLLQIYFYNNDEQRWINYGGIVDPTDGPGYAGKITITTDHFSIYAVGLAVEFNPDSSYLDVESDSIYLEDNAPIPFSIYLKDQFGEGFQGKEAYLKSMPETGLLIEQSDTVSSSTGIISGHIIAETEGIYILYVVDINGDTIISDTFELSVLKKADLISSETSYIQLYNDTAYNDGIDTISFDIFINNENGNGLSNIDVQIKIRNLNDTTDTIYLIGKTDSNGLISKEITSLLYGSKVISVLNLEHQFLINDTKTIEFIKLPEVSSQYSLFNAVSTELILEYGETTTYVLNIVDEAENIMSGIFADITVSSEGLNVVQSDNYSDTYGKITGLIIPDTFGTYVLSVKNADSELLISDTIVINVISVYSTISADSSFIDVSKDTAYVDGSETVSFNIMIMNNEEIGLRDIDVQIKIQNLNDTTDTIYLTGKTDSNGLITKEITSFIYGSKFISVLNLEHQFLINDTAIIKFIRLPEISSEFSEISVSKEKLIFEHNDTSSFIIEIRNDYNQPVSNIKINLISNPDSLTITYDTFYTDINGIVSGNILPDTYGTFMLLVADDTDNLIISDTQVVEVISVYSIIAGDSSYFLMNNYSHFADGINTVTGNVVIRDNKGNHLENVELNIIIQNVDTTDTYIIQGITDSYGKLFFELISTVPCTKFLTVKDKFGVEIVSNYDLIYFIDLPDFHLSKDSVYLEDSETIYFSFNLKDSENNPIENKNALLKVVSDDSVNGISIFYNNQYTDSEGIISGEILPIDEGVYNLFIVDDTDNLLISDSRTLTVSKKINYVVPEKSRIDIINDTAYADGSETIAFDIFIFDDNEIGLSNITVKIMVSNLDAESDSEVIIKTTDNAGRTFVELSSYIYGNKSIEVYSLEDVVLVNDTKTIKFIKVPVLSDINSSFTIEESVLVLDHTETTSFIINVRDEENRPMSGRWSVWAGISASQDGLVKSYETNLTDTAGMVKGIIQAETTGVYILTVVEENGSFLISDTAEITVLRKVDIVDAEKSRIDIINDTAYADGSETIAVDIFIFDDNEIGLSNITVKIMVSNLDAESDSEVIIKTTDNAGRTFVELSSYIYGNKSIEVYSLEDIVLVNDTKIINFIKVPVLCDINSSFTIEESVLVLDHTETTSFIINVRDEENRPMSGRWSVWAGISVSQEGLVKIYETNLTDTAGMVKGIIQAETTGVYILTVVEENGSVLISDTAEITVLRKVDIVDAEKSRIDIINDTAYADGSETIAFDIFISDENGTGLSNISVKIMVSNIDAESDSEVIIKTTDNAGRTFVKLSSYIYGNKSIEVYSLEDVVLVNDTKTIEFIKVPVVCDKNSSFTLEESVLVLDHTETTSFIINVRDEEDRPMSGRWSVWAGISASQDGLVKIYETNLTDTDGMVKGIIQAETTGVYILTVVKENGSFLISDTAEITVLRKVDIVDAEKSSIVISNDTALADGQDTVLIFVNIVSIDNKPLSSLTGELIITSEFQIDAMSDTLIQLNEYSDENGQITYILSSDIFGYKSIDFIIDDTIYFDSKTVDFQKISVPVINDLYIFSNNNSNNNRSDTAVRRAKNILRVSDTAVEIRAYISDYAGTEFLSVELNIDSIRNQHDTVSIVPDTFDILSGEVVWSDVLISELVEGNNYTISLNVYDRYYNSASETIGIKVAGNFVLIDTSEDTELEIASSDEKSKLIINTNMFRRLPDGWQYFIRINRISHTNRTISPNEQYNVRRARNLSVKLLPELHYGQYELTISKVDENFSNEQRLNNREDFLNNDGYIEFKVSYPDFLDDIYARNLKIFYYDEENNYFDEQTTYVDLTEKSLTAKLTHFSIYFVAMSIPSNLEDLVVFPNPWTQYSIHNNPPRMIFQGIPPSANIKIFNVAGELVYEKNNLSTTIWEWNMRNNHGNRVASGVYIYMLEHDGNRKIGKISIIK